MDRVKVKSDSVQLRQKEKNLIKLIRDTGFGEIRIKIQDGLPIRVEELKKSIKL